MGAASGLAIAILLTFGPDPPRPLDSTQAQAQAPSGATVTLYGRAGSFGSVGGTTPSGQGVSLTAVPGWNFAPGVQAYRTTLAADGTVFIAGLGHTVDFATSTADRVVVSAYDPRANRFTNIPIGPVGRGAPSVSDLEGVSRGTAIAFTTRSRRNRKLVWPAFGVVAQTDGRWRVAQVRGGEALGTELGEMTTLPRSRDLVVTGQDGVLVLRLSGPDAAGQYAARVAGRYRYPKVSDEVTVKVREVQADPTGRPGDERFAVGLDVLRADKNTYTHSVVQEFSFDARTGAVWPVSAPLIPGDRSKETSEHFGFGTFLYDDRGNLWVSRLDGLRGGKLAVYAARGGRRKLEDPPCQFRAGKPDAGPAWGQACRPDYDILQTQQLPGLQGLSQDPSTKDIIALALGGFLVPIRLTGTGDKLSFRVGNLVDVGRKLLPTADGDWIDHRLGGVDSAHRVWLTTMHSRPGLAGARQDQWLYSVDTRDLFAPAPVRLPVTPGESVTVQAERSATTSTTQHRGKWATVDVDSDVYVHGCADWPDTSSCGYDGVAGNGFALGDHSGFGYLHGAVQYLVDVPSAGAYRLSFRVATLPVTKDARIALTAGGRTYTVKVSTGGPWQQVRLTGAIDLPAGAQTIALSVPRGGAGWYLNSFTLQRA